MEVLIDSNKRSLFGTLWLWLTLMRGRVCERVRRDADWGVHLSIGELVVNLSQSITSRESSAKEIT
jgi:hypothetical protein